MATVDITDVKKRVIAILLAAPQTAPYSGSVIGLNSQPATGRYGSNDEIERAILEADARVCLAIIESIGNGYRSQFLTESTGLSSGDNIPAHVGQIGLVKVDDSPARLARSRNQMIQVIENPELYPEAQKWFWTDDVTIYHNGTEATVEYPSFEIDTDCQSPDVYESAVVSGSVGLLMKDGGASDYYGYYARLYAQQEALIRGGATVIPPVEEYEVKAA